MSEGFSLVFRVQVGKAVWDEFSDASDEAWLWHRYDLQDALSTWPDVQDISFGVMGLDGELVAILPLYISRRKYFHLINLTRLESLGGLALRNSMGSRQSGRVKEFVRESLVALARRHNAMQIGFSLPPIAPAFRGERCPLVNPLLLMGCENTLTQTWVVDLRKGKDAVWQALEGRARTAIRKAEKSRVTVRSADQPEDQEIYYKLHCETYQRTGVRPHPKAYFSEIWQSFYQRGLAQIWFAEIEGQVVAAENFGVYKNAAIYWTGAASAKGLAVEANSLLQWKAMEWMLDKGLEWYETGEAFPNIREGKSKGLNDFKKSFGGELFPYFKGRISTATTKHKALNALRDLMR